MHPDQKRARQNLITNPSPPFLAGDTAVSPHFRKGVLCSIFQKQQVKSWQVGNSPHGLFRNGLCRQRSMTRARICGLTKRAADVLPACAVNNQSPQGQHAGSASRWLAERKINMPTLSFEIDNKVDAECSDNMKEAIKKASDILEAANKVG